MVRWCNGSMVQWCNDAMVQWCNGAIVQWCDVTTVCLWLASVACCVVSWLTVKLEVPGSIPDRRGSLEVKSKGKVFYGQELPSGESTTTECGFNYQLLAVIY